MAPLASAAAHQEPVTPGPELGQVSAAAQLPQALIMNGFLAGGEAAPPRLSHVWLHQRYPVLVPMLRAITPLKLTPRP